MKNQYFKKSLVAVGIFMLLLFVNAGFSQPAVAWHSCFGGSGTDNVYAIDQTYDSGYIAAGETNSNNGQVIGYHGAIDGWIVKMNKNGILQWQKCVGGLGEDKIYSIQQTKDSGYIAVGRTYSDDSLIQDNHGVSDFFVIKLKISGDIVWQKCYGGSDYDYARSVQQTFDGGYILAGSSSSNNGQVTGHHGVQDYWIVKIDSGGEIQWQKCLGGSATDDAYSIQQTKDSGYIVCGQAASNDDDVTDNQATQSAWVVKLDKSGNIQWNHCYGGNRGGLFYSVKQTRDLGFVFAGVKYPNGGYAFNNDFMIVKTKNNGIIEWQKYYGGDSLDEAKAIYQTMDGGYIVSGDVESNTGNITGNHGKSDAWLIRLDSLGLLLWQKCLGGTSYDVSNSVMQTFDGGYISSGCAYSSDGDVTGNHGEWDFLVVKLESDLNVNSIDQNSPLQIYPNPTSGIIHLSCPNQVEMVIDVYNITGLLVLRKTSNQSETEIDISDLAQGMYIIKASGTDVNLVKKIIKE
jgi:hypothetical protein